MDVQSDRCNFFPVSTKVYILTRKKAKTPEEQTSESFYPINNSLKWKHQIMMMRGFFLYLYVMLSICILLQVCGIKLENPRKSLLLWHFSKIKNYDTNRITLKKPPEIKTFGTYFQTLWYYSLTLVFKVFLNWCQVVRINDFLKS